MGENKVFADAFNFLIYGGRRVVDPEKLRSIDPTEIGLLYERRADREEEYEQEKDKKIQETAENRRVEGNEITEDAFKKASVPNKILPHKRVQEVIIQRYRDLLKHVTIMEDGELVYLLLGIENQAEVHYAMPVKNLVYDALQYARQVEQIGRRHKNERNYKGRSSGEYLSGFYKEDRIIPVITLVIFFSPEKWDGPLSLYDMMEMKSPRVLSLVQDYKIHLVEPAALTREELEKFQSSLREVISFIKYSKDKKKLAELLERDKKFKHLDPSAALVINTCTRAEITIKEGEEEIDMCQAIEEMKRDSMEEGMQRGIEKGMQRGIEKGMQQGIEQGMQQGIEQGMQQGIEQGARKTALNLLQIGMPVEQIAHMVGYSSGEVCQWFLRAKKL